LRDSSSGRTGTTALSRIVVALNLFMLYLMLNWLPTDEQRGPL